MTEFADPTPPPESSGEGPSMRAKDLKNQPLILRPTKHDVTPGKDDKPWEFVEADVWVLDRSGVVAHASGVRFSWWKVREQLRTQIGQFVAGRPKEGDDNSVHLEALSGPAREVAVQAMKEIATAATSDEAPPAWDEETF